MRTANIAALNATVMTNIPVMKWTGLCLFDVVMPMSMAKNLLARSSQQLAISNRHSSFLARIVPLTEPRGHCGEAVAGGTGLHDRPAMSSVQGLRRTVGLSPFFRSPTGLHSTQSDGGRSVRQV